MTPEAYALLAGLDQHLQRASAVLFLTAFSSKTVLASTFERIVSIIGSQTVYSPEIITAY